MENTHAYVDFLARECTFNFVSYIDVRVYNSCIGLGKIINPSILSPFAKVKVYVFSTFVNVYYKLADAL